MEQFNRLIPIKPFPLVYLLLLVSIVFCHSLNMDGAYRLLSYVNEAVVIYYGIQRWREGGRLYCHKLPLLIWAPIGIIALHFVAVAGLLIAKDVRSIVLTIFFSVGISICVGIITNSSRFFRSLSIVFITAYVFAQGTAFLFFGLRNGTTENPHYLAQYCLLLLPLTVYLFFSSEKFGRWLMAGASFCLIALLLSTSSRPAWIGLVLAAVIFLIHMRGRNRLAALVGGAVLFDGLYFSDVFGFGSRLKDLYSNIRTEERVYIWQNAVAMLKDGDVKQWIFGHGLNSFRSGFKSYSVFHGKGIDFNSPHNFVLELIFTSGVLGALIMVSFFVYIYFVLVCRYSERNGSPYVLMLIAILTANLALTSVTIPFFTSYNLIVLGLICGLLPSLKKSNNCSH